MIKRFWQWFWRPASASRWGAMHWEEQGRKAKMKMKKASKKGLTCIQCHHGIAHGLPDDYDFEEEMTAMGYGNLFEESEEDEERLQSIFPVSNTITITTKEEHNL
jgi:hypothetical protein